MHYLRPLTISNCDPVFYKIPVANPAWNHLVLPVMVRFRVALAFLRRGCSFRKTVVRQHQSSLSQIESESNLFLQLHYD